MTLFHHEPTAELQVDNVTQTVVTVGTTSTVLIAANPERKFIRIKHQSSGGTAFIYLRFSATAATTTNAYEIAEGQEFREGVGEGTMIYTGEIRVIASSAGRPVYVEERY